MSRENVKHYFELLGKILSDHGLHNRPSNIFNVDETGLQLNNKPAKVLAAKGSKNVSSITSGEKGETISVIACCNAEGTFLPPYSIFKGKNKKMEFLDGMPNGSNIAMGEKSAYVNASIFLDWLKNHFLPRKPAGTALLILDGHTSHTNSVEVLEFCEENNIILLCLPSHTTHYLQPLDRAFFKSLKSNYYVACNNYVKANPTRKLSRLQFGRLLGFAWNKSASVENGIAGFRATGIAPYNPEIIPDYAYVGINMESTATQNAPEFPTLQNSSQSSDSGPRSPSPLPGCSHYGDISPRPRTPSPLPSCPGYPGVPKPLKTPSPRPISSKYSDTLQVTVASKTKSSDPTPGKLLDTISPLPVTSSQVLCKKRGRQLASVLNTPERIEGQRNKKPQIND